MIIDRERITNYAIIMILSLFGRKVASAALVVPLHSGRSVASSICSRRPSTCTTMRCSSSSLNHVYGEDMDQDALMESDMLVAVDENDNLIHSAVLSKRQGHTFHAGQPRAVLHRAFSFFLFNQSNELLLTQRAPSKITFPNVWTNTVCSHPLYGMHPNEVDHGVSDYPNFPGIKQAAARKCQHELGIASLDIQSMQFVTRFHYWAADTITYGSNTTWGEHEVDYILFLKLKDNESIKIQPNPEEVSAHRFVSIEGLREMLRNEQLLWSPWFLGIMERGGTRWWEDLDNTLQGKYTNRNIEFFDPPPKHMAYYNLNSHNRQTGVLSNASEH